MFENRVVRVIRFEMEETTRGQGKLHVRNFSMCRLLFVSNQIKLDEMGKHVVRVENVKNAYAVLFGEL